jgi:hypothetical protein
MRKRRERRDRNGNRQHRQERDPDRRGERVVEQAVGDEAVAACVPEVVPEQEAVLQIERALVDVRREVVAGRPEPDEQAGEEGGRA